MSGYPICRMSSDSLDSLDFFHGFLGHFPWIQWTDWTMSMESRSQNGHDNPWIKSNGRCPDFFFHRQYTFAQGLCEQSRDCCNSLRKTCCVALNAYPSAECPWIPWTMFMDFVRLEYLNGCPWTKSRVIDWAVPEHPGLFSMNKIHELFTMNNVQEYHIQCPGSP